MTLKENITEHFNKDDSTGLTIILNNDLILFQFTI